MTHPTVKLVGRYPALLKYLQKVLVEAFPKFQISTENDLSLPFRSKQGDLLIYLHDRSAPLEINRLAEWDRASSWYRSVLVLSEQPIRVAPQLEPFVVLRDLSIDLQTLCEAIDDLYEKRNHQGRESEHDTVRETDSCFTRKERQVLSHLRHGLSNKLIAQRMEISESAVKFHMGKLFAKTGCESRIHMALMAGQLLEGHEAC